METKIKSASVKIMLSYDYSHFETCMSLENEEGISQQDIDNARKDCQRLCDKAVKQYKIAKQCAANRQNGKYEMRNFERECERIANMPAKERTTQQKAMLKQYQNENWQAQFDYAYDYEDEPPYEDAD